MNSNFDRKQIIAYAAAFEAGDAIWCDGKWWEVFCEGGVLTNLSPNQYFINRNYGDLAVIGGFENTSAAASQFPYRVTTLADYELQGGEKLVWLGNTNNFSFGEVYEVKHKPESDVNVFVYDNDGYVRTPKSKSWAVIPKYEQVQSIERKEVKTSDIANTLYKRYYDVLQNALHNDIENALQDSDYQKVVELSGLIIEMEEGK